MKNPSPEQRAKWNRSYYERNGKAVVEAHAYDHRTRNLEYIRKIKDTTPCADCGNQYPHYVMDFDHLPGHEKVGSVAVMAHNRFGLATIKAEIAKCEVVCSNCHRSRTWNRKGDERASYALS